LTEVTNSNEELTIPAKSQSGPVLVEALRNYWYPVARSREVTEAPVAARLLDEPLVLWRDPSTGEVAAFYDLCIHRGTPLSLGWIDGDTLVCAYHGWGYNAGGACVRIPSLPDGAAIPRKARATAYNTRERHGLVWVCLGEPVADIPPFPAEFDDPEWDFETLSNEGFIQANAARYVENLLDFSHFAWLHPGILGDRDHPQTQDIEIRHYDDGFEFDFSGFGEVRADKPADAEEETPVWTRKKVVLPFAIYISTGVDPERHGIIACPLDFWVCCPLSTKETKFYRFASWRKSNGEPSDWDRQEGYVIFEQDRPVVEAQRPEELPLDLREELHLRGPDACTLEYRRYLSRIGVEWG
jgi:phenylpropionate dioxygenase-like ring-hydroxylating dioxygenase large terminal subunit